MPGIYLDHHATTPCDPRVVEAMLPMLTENFGNIHSVTHAFGREAKQAVDAALQLIADSLGCVPDEIILTSGATESNNLALLGFLLHPRQKRNQIITVASEHVAVLDPIDSLKSRGFEVIRLPVMPQGHEEAGRVDFDAYTAAINERTAIVSVMLANNEIGVIQDLQNISQLAHQYGAVVHTDATQAIGKMNVDVDTLDVDLLSASAHKLYGPKGIGLLYVRRKGRRIRIVPQILGGGQQHGIRSGTVNAPGCVAFAKAIELCIAERATGHDDWIYSIADRFYRHIESAIPDIQLNGPVRKPTTRLPGNLNIQFPNVEGASILAAIPELAASSGAACSSVDPRPSHVLTAIGLSESATRRSLRFGFGRFNTVEEIDLAASWICNAYTKLSRTD